MGPLWQQYIHPANLAEALQALGTAPGPACPIAGGTDLLLELRQGRKPPVHTLVDVSGIPDLNVVEVRGVELFIGAAVPLSQVIASPLVYQHARALVESCDLIGGPQVRNVATLGGNVAHALPAADGAIALLALGAEAAVAEYTEKVILTRKPLQDLYLGPGKSVLKPTQLLVGFGLPLTQAGQGSAFARVMRLQGVALPIENMAVWLERDRETITNIRIAIGPAGPIPKRSPAAETVLRGQSPNFENLAAARQALLDEAHFRTSPHRATAWYRQHLSAGLLTEAITKAWERAK